MIERLEIMRWDLPGDSIIPDLPLLIGSWAIELAPRSLCVCRPFLKCHSKMTLSWSLTTTMVRLKCVRTDERRSSELNRERSLGEYIRMCGRSPMSTRVAASATGDLRRWGG